MHVLIQKPDRERGFKKERILRVLLNDPEGELTKYRVAKEAEATEPWTREYTSELERRGILNDTRVLKPRKLYEEWRNTRIQPNTLEVSLQQPKKILDETDLKYATTTYTAENLYQGFLFESKTDLYIDPRQARDWTELIENRGGAIGGGNTRLRATDKHVFYQTQEIRGTTTVSVPQLIVDLLDEGGPCEEAAQKLIDKSHSEADG
jgi:hypothetical protein